jgi:predicted RNase H-like HicB family nuclease
MAGIGSSRLSFAIRECIFRTLSEVLMSKRMRIPILVERLPEGVYLGTSEKIPGLTVECDTPEETASAAEDVALDLLEAEVGHSLDPRPEFTVTYK